MRVVICDDSALLREGIAALLGRAGIEVAALASSPEELHAAVAEHAPDVAIIDIRMPPTFTDEGLRAAYALRKTNPGIAIVILSQHVEAGTATRLLAESPYRLGYLLKDRVSDLDDFVATLRTVAAGGSALDPQIVAGLLASRRGDGPLASLSAREREVLALVAEGRTDRGIAEALWLSPKTVETHVRTIFRKLDLPSSRAENRRVHAVLTFLDVGSRT
jgi:DNA-binding NarL/FixJ family response regulator